MPPRLGAHMSIAGGLDRAVDRAVAAGCDALQVFTRSASQWAARPLDPLEVGRFKAKSAAAGLHPVLAHDSYLINVASPDEALWTKSLGALRLEVERCAALGIPYLVMHPGAHLGAGETAGIARIAAALDVLHAEGPESVTILLENTAGQGTCLGRTFDELADIVARTRRPERLGVCVDTAHALAAGYDLADEAGWDAAWRAFDRSLGPRALRALHVNDSKKPRGSRVDRHEHIGLGHLGPRAFWRLVNDPRFDGLPATLETEKGDEGLEDAQNLAVLRKLAGRAKPPGPAEVARWRAAVARTRGVDA